MLTLTRGERADVVPLEVVVGRPRRGRRAQGLEQLEHPGLVAVGLPAHHGLLAEQVDGGRAARAPERVEPGHRLGRRRADDELLGHPGDVLAGHPRLDGRAEGHPVGEVDAEVERLGHVDAVEVLGQVAGDVLVAVERREHVDEPEQLRLEGGPRHRPVHHPVAPPRHAEDLRALARRPSSAMRRASACVSRSTPAGSIASDRTPATAADNLASIQRPSAASATSDSGTIPAKTCHTWIISARPTARRRRPRPPPARPASCCRRGASRGRRRG